MYFTKITYKQALETYWSEIKDEDKILLYRPDFGWVKPDEAKRIEALRKYQKIKDLI